MKWLIVASADTLIEVYGVIRPFEIAAVQFVGPRIPIITPPAPVPLVLQTSL